MAYNLNASLVSGGGSASQPEFGPFGRTANTTLYWAGYSSMYNALQVKLDRRFAAGLDADDGVHMGQGNGLPKRRRRRPDVLCESAAQLCTQRLRPDADVRAELRLRSAARSRQAVAEIGRGVARDRRLAGSGILTLMTGTPLVSAAARR